jgi:TIR domain
VAYTHDIFISYRRDPETLKWIKDHLEPLLRLRLGLELPNSPDIYTDLRIKGGATWPVELGRELAQSKVLISLWSGNYLHSKWCTLELAHMVAREKKFQLRTPHNSSGVVFFVIAHDGEKIPHELQAIQKVEIQSCFNVRMRRDSPRAEELDAILAQNASEIARAIQNAPKFNDKWPKQVAQAFFDRFHQKDPPSQSTVPQFT